MQGNEPPGRKLGGCMSILVDRGRTCPKRPIAVICAEKTGSARF